MLKVLFVCLGNICRSPMAEFVMKQMVAEKGLADKFEIASAATEGYNEMVHEALDYRAADMLKQMKVPFTQHYSRQIRKSDYDKFDYILAMDDNNVRDILDIVGGDKDHKVHRLLDFTKNPRPVKDPWYTGNFDEAYWDIYEGCQAFLEYLESMIYRRHKMKKKILSVPQIRALMKKGTPMIFGTDLLQSFYEYGQEAMKITMELNNKYHTPEKVRELFSKLIARKVDKDCLILPPFYTEFGKNIKLGKCVFINTCCHFQDNGGIEIGDHSMLGSNVTIATLNHEFAPEKRCNANPKPVKIGKNVWIGANVTILPGVSIGDNSIIGAASVVTKDIPANTLAYGSPCKAIRKIK